MKVSKGQRVDYKSGLTQMVGGDFVREEWIERGTVVGFFKAGRYIRVRKDGASKSETGLITEREIVKAY